MSGKPPAALNGSRRTQFIASVRIALRHYDEGRTAFSALQAIRHALAVLDKNRGDTDVYTRPEA